MPKRTPLFEEHRRAGAKFVEFAGWEMPVFYSSIAEEVKATRRAVAVYDISHMGEISVSGGDALEFVNRIVTNDVSVLRDGEALYTVMCKDDGGILDDLVVYRISGEELLLVVNAANTEKDFRWLKGHAPSGARVENVSERYAMIAVQGPKAQEILSRISSVELASVGYYCFVCGEVAGRKAMISRTGYTGEDGFEVFVSPEDSPHVWGAILEEARKVGGRPAGLGARDVCRLEASYLLYGSDMDEATNPLEVGLSWVVKFEKGDFIGREALLKAKEKGVGRRIRGIVMRQRAIPRHGYKVFTGSKEPVGFITSGTFSPTLGKPIALSLIQRGRLKLGEPVLVEIRGKLYEGETVKLPFYRGSVKTRKRR